MFYTSLFLLSFGCIAWLGCMEFKGLAAHVCGVLSLVALVIGILLWLR